MPRPPFARHRPLGFEPLEARQMLAADLEVLKDVNVEPIGIEIPYGLNGVRSVEVAGEHFFVRSDPAHGWELWKTDGTLEGMQLVRDIVPGTDSEPIRQLTKAGNLLFFHTRFHLWKSDGTPEGTIPLKQLKVIGSSLDDNQMIEMNGECYFFAETPEYGVELWKSDGTAAGTQIVKDINPGAVSSHPSDRSDFAVLNGVLYFGARQEGTRTSPMPTIQGLWRTDGTEEGTFYLKDLQPHSYGNLPQDFIAVGDKIFFTHFRELWSTDGTATGTVPLKEFSNYAPSRFREFNGELFFSGHTFTVGEFYGDELWKSNGTPEGTVLVKDIKPGPLDGRVNDLIVLGDTLFFTAESSSQIGTELWRTDGTETGTFMVKDINTDRSSDPSNLISYGGRLYFTANDGLHGYELWTSDGTEEGTHLFADLNPGSAHFFAGRLWHLGDLLYFQREISDTEIEYWVSDFTPEGTHPIDVASNQTYDARPRELTQAGDLAYFIADDGQHGSELWATDGTTAGTYLVRDIFAGEGSAFDESLPAYGQSIVAVVGNTVYFLADDGTYGEELWKSDGTFEGTGRISDIAAGGAGAQIRDVAVIDGTLYFSANDGIVGAELWMSDGTQGGTKLVGDLTPGPTGSDPKGFVEAVDAIYFRATGDHPGAELWTTNGTPEGTQRLTDPLAGPFPNELLVVNDELHFFGGATGGQRILWKVISSGGDFELVNAHTFAPSPRVRATGVVGETIYFLSGSPFPVTLWKTDGTPEGTAVVKEFPTGRDSLSDGFILNGKFYFVLDDLESGRELWASDGTEAGTTLLIDAAPGPAGGDPTDFQEIDGEVYFRVTKPNGNHELWKTDGTSEGTQMLTTLLLDPVDGSYPLSLAKFGSLLIVAASAPGSGSELLYLDLTADALPGDYNRDLVVDQNDYLFWKEHWGATLGTGLLADGNGNGVVDAADFTIWRNHLGMAIPPAAASLVVATEVTETKDDPGESIDNPALFAFHSQLSVSDAPREGKTSQPLATPRVEEVTILTRALLLNDARPRTFSPHREAFGFIIQPARTPATAAQSAEISDMALEQLWGVEES